MSNYFSVDGIGWPWPCHIGRNAEIKLTDISGVMLDGSIFNDVFGTYMSYDVTLAAPVGQETVYNAFYELLSSPVEGHTFVFPYNGGNVEITGFAAGLQDTYVPMTDGNYWKGLTFTITSNYPTKYESLGEVLSRGRIPAPAQTSYEDADEKYY